MIANSVNTTATFTNTNIKKGGQVVEEIHGNRVIRMSKEGGTFAIESEGDLRFNVKVVVTTTSVETISLKFKEKLKSSCRG